MTADGVTMPLPRPFLVLATQNPVELEGTFPLPEAQLDRFFLRLQLGYPSADEEEEILLRVADTDPLEELDAAIGVEELQKLKSDATRVYVSDAYGPTSSLWCTPPEADRIWCWERAPSHIGAVSWRTSRGLPSGWPYVRPDDVKSLRKCRSSHHPEHRGT